MRVTEGTLIFLYILLKQYRFYKKSILFFIKFILFMIKSETYLLSEMKDAEIFTDNETELGDWILEVKKY